MTTPYDVLARIRSGRATPEPTGECCEMCAESIADEHQHVVNVAGRQLMCVPRLLSAVHRRASRTALPRGAG